MRGLFGALVLAAGVGGLGYWGSQNNAVTMEGKVTQRAAAAVSGAIHDVTTTVNGRDITVSGQADSVAERDSLIAALDAVQGRRVVRDDLVILPKADPFTMTGDRASDGVNLSGAVPTEALRAALLAMGAQANGLDLSSGAPAGWAEAAVLTVKTLEPLNNGQFDMTGTQVTLTGEAQTPAEKDAVLAALDKLPEGFTHETTITVVDDGIPDFSLSFDANSGLRVDGKLPKGLTAQAVAQMFGLRQVGGDSFTSWGEGASIRGVLQGLAGWLPEFDDLALSHKAGETRVSGRVANGVDANQVTAGLRADIGDVPMQIAPTQRTATDGETRVNVLTGETEVYSGGFWLPQVDFSPSVAQCTQEADAVLARSKVNFVTGSAELDARSIRTVNWLASVARACVTGGGLRLELGGHTDNTGNPLANLTLSRERAEAVRDALDARGIADQAMAARGFGATMPIASNDTEEGRAANRRTTITWIAGE